jgi:hypothetical protein
MKSDISILWILMSFSLALLFLTQLSDRAIGGSLQDEIAIKGYDTVAYFKMGKAVQGNKSFSFQWHNMTWYFLNKEHRDLFAAMPAKYAPQYDGYCAWAMTEARLAKTDPEVWKIVDGRLYLNCSRDAYLKWSRDIPGNIKKADANWLKFINKK